jgi:hypothetical protein
VLPFDRERTILLIAALALTLFAATAAQAATRGNLIMRGGAIYTLDVARPWASALVIEGGRIVYVGDDAGTQGYVGPGTRVIALDGRMVLPGFHDAHIHPMTGAMRLVRCRLGDFKTARQVYAAVRACAAAKPKREWLLGSGWSPQAFGDGAPSLAKLDQLVPDRPAFLTTEDGFTAWVNSKALAIAGVHEPTGIVKDEAADLIRRHIPQPSEAEYREALRRSTAIANRFGITSMFDAYARSEAVLGAYHAADLAGEMSVRVVAALLEPYADMPGLRGELYIQPDALNAIVRRLDADGFLIHMHAMGDRAVRAGLDAIEHAIQANGARDRRHQLAHIGVAHPDDIRRFGRLGIAANFQPIWFPADDPVAAPTEAVLGPERSRWILPMASIAAGGGRIIASSDWPGPSMNPLDAIQFAVTRQPLDGSRPAREPQERVGLAEILAAYTKDAAWVAREEAINGSIEIGKAADLIVLDRNLFEVDVMALHEVRVLLTLLDGEPVYRDRHFAWP